MTFHSTYRNCQRITLYLDERIMMGTVCNDQKKWSQSKYPFKEFKICTLLETNFRIQFQGYLQVIRIAYIACATLKNVFSLREQTSLFLHKTTPVSLSFHLSPWKVSKSPWKGSSRLWWALTHRQTFSVLRGYQTDSDGSLSSGTDWKGTDPNEKVLALRTSTAVPTLRRWWCNVFIL